VLLEKLIIAQLVKKFPAFSGTRRITVVFRLTNHWAVTWATFVHSTHSYPNF